LLGSDFVYPDGDLLNEESLKPIENLRFAFTVALSPSGLVAASTSAHDIVLLRP